MNFVSGSRTPACAKALRSGEWHQAGVTDKLGVVIVQKRLGIALHMQMREWKPPHWLVICEI